jgi:hypothetical protein
MTSFNSLLDATPLARRSGIGSLGNNANQHHLYVIISPDLRPRRSLRPKRTRRLCPQLNNRHSTAHFESRLVFAHRNQMDVRERYRLTQFDLSIFIQSTATSWPNRDPPRMRPRP